MLPAAALVNFARVGPAQRVLDVACGTGVVAITAARAGAQVSALDLTPELLERARYNSKTSGFNIEWHEGDVESLPFPDSSFDAVLSQFGHIFAPRPDLALSEMLRVLKPGGTIAFSTWPPDLFVGRMFFLTSRYMPAPPPGAEPPVLWGEPTIIRTRFGDSVRNIVFQSGIGLSPALSPQHFRLASEQTIGPLIKLVETLRATDPAKLDAFRREYDSIVEEYFSQNVVQHGYLLTRAVKN